ncbi:MAG: DUF1570 domain-containing protein [Tepidisphaeraceae bacterium]
MRDYKLRRPLGVLLSPRACPSSSVRPGPARRAFVAACLCAAATAFAGSPSVFESQHYRIHSDLEPAVTQDYARRLDAMFGEYARRLADFELPSQTKFDVYLFEKRADYQKFTGNSLPNTAGMFIPALHALAGFEELRGRDGLRKTLQHEAFHQFAWSAISKNMPIWLDEGLAQIFEEGVWTGNRFILGQVPPGRLRDLRNDLNSNRFVPFRTFLTMSREQFQARMSDLNLGRAQYNQAWAMTQFLIFDTDDAGRPRYRRRLINWLRDLHSGKNAQTAFAANFSPNIDGFEQRFKEWARSAGPTPMAVYSDRVSKLAEVVRLFQRDGMVFKSIDDLRDYLAKGQFHLSEKRVGDEQSRDENVMTFLCNINGQPWSSNELYFDHKKSPLPDIVLRPPQESVIRARFYTSGKSIDHDLVFENP